MAIISLRSFAAAAALVLLLFRSVGKYDSAALATADPSHSFAKAKITCHPNGTTCTDPLGVVGEWVDAGDNRTFDSPVCCGIDQGAIQGHNANVGCRWPPNLDPLQWRGYPDPVIPALVGGNACTCGFVDRYVWQSPDLPSRFIPGDTCALLGNRTALFVGDSTMSQAATTLMNSLRFGHCQTNVVWAGSDTLVGRDYGAMNRGRRWGEWVDRYDPDIVVVAVGAHVNADDASFAALVDEVLGEMKAMRQKRPALKMAFKTQSPGGCTKDISFPKNATHAATTLDFVRMKEIYGMRTYNWDRYYHRDLMLLSRLQEAGIPYLDMRMLYSRTDAHVCSQGSCRDCLHLCSPGPLDVMGRLFHQLLLEIGSD